MFCVFEYLHSASSHLHIWQLAAGIRFEGRSLCLWSDLIRCADVCPILFSADSVNTICTFHFSRLLFHPSPPSASKPCSSTPACLLPPPPHCSSFPPCLLLYPLVWSQCKSGAFCCSGWYFWSNTCIYVSSTHDCDRRVYNVIRLCQTCQRSPVVHLKAIYRVKPVHRGDLLWFFPVPWLSFCRWWHAAAHEYKRRFTYKFREFSWVLNSDRLSWSEQQAGAAWVLP